MVEKTKEAQLLAIGLEQQVPSTKRVTVSLFDSSFNKNIKIGIKMVSIRSEPL